jgi:hypothetical protein
MRHSVPPRPGDDEERTRRTFVGALLWLAAMVGIAMAIRWLL